MIFPLRLTTRKTMSKLNSTRGGLRARLLERFRLWRGAWRRRDPGPLDDIKLAVLILLAGLVVVFLLPAVTGRSDEGPVVTLAPSAETPFEPGVTLSITNSPSPSPAPPTATLAPTAGVVSGGGGTSVVPAVPTLVPEEQNTPALTLTPTVSAPGSGSIPSVSFCPQAMPSQLAVGMQARTARDVNIRSSPGIRQNWRYSIAPGVVVVVVGGPECVLYGSLAYIWWEIETPDGLSGWSAEGSSTGEFYFLVPAF